MIETGDHPLHSVLGRFPWRRRKPRAGRGRRLLAYKTRAGRVLWSELDALVDFEDPGPALAYAVLRGDEIGQTMIAALVEHHAHTLGVTLPPTQGERTRAGLRVLKQLMMKSGLDPKHTIGEQTLDELVAVTWALGAVPFGKSA